MKISEITTIVAAIIVLFIVGSFQFVIESNTRMISLTLLFSSIIILATVFSKKLVASYLDLGIEHKIWSFSRWGLRRPQTFNKRIPIGLIFPLFVTLFTLGLVKFPSILTYEANTLKRRAAKRHGFYSYTEMTEMHNGLIGATGIASILVISLIAYFLPYQGFEYLSQLAAFYAFANILPIGNLDGAQTFFGSRVLWTILAAITLTFVSFAAIII